jgi:microcystin-dependent protein
MLRAKSRSINNTTFINNRLVRFAKNPSKTLDVIVERDETIHNDLTVGNDITVGGDLSAKNFYANGGNFFLDSYLLIPYGTIIQSAAISVPDGWLNCDGAIVLRTVYENLFNAIGYTYSSFSGSDLSFNVPDLKGRVAVGSGSGAGLTSRTLGSKGGAETHVLTTGEMPSHNHGVTDPGHSHNWNYGTEGDDSGNGSSNSEFTTTGGIVSGAIASATTGITINNNGSGNAHNNMQPFIVLRYFIKY